MRTDEAVQRPADCRIDHFVVVIALGVALTLAACSRQQAAPAGQAPPPAVKVVRVQAQNLPQYREFVGQTRGRQDVDVRARVQGYVQTINFQQGTNIKEGALLFTIDKRAYEAALAQAKAAQAQLQSQFQQLESDAKRYAELMKTGVISKQQAEQTASQAQASKAAVDAQQAVVKGREIDLAFTDVRAPISGRIGLTPYSIGDLVGTQAAAEKPLATISDLTSVRVRFAISETDYLRYVKQNPGAASSNGRGAGQNLQLTLADGSIYPYPGAVVTADNAIDPSSGTLTVEAEFPNPDSVLRTGQYAKVRVTARELKDAMVIPARAVQDQQGISSVLVVTDSDRVESRAVHVGDRSGDLWPVTEGLKAGERVIVEGLTKAVPGALVKPEEVASSPPAAIPPAAGAAEEKSK